MELYPYSQTSSFKGRDAWDRPRLSDFGPLSDFEFRPSHLPRLSPVLVTGRGREIRYGCNVVAALVLKCCACVKRPDLFVRSFVFSMSLVAADFGRRKLSRREKVVADRRARLRVKRSTPEISVRGNYAHSNSTGAKLRADGLGKKEAARALPMVICACVILGNRFLMFNSAWISPFARASEYHL